MVSEQMVINHKILCDLIELRNKKELTNKKSDHRKYNIAFNKAMSRFGYIVDIHSFKYKSFPNYQDIIQEGKIGLAFALEKFNPERSKNFFRIANWYCKTRIKRSANKHCVVNTSLNSTERATINRIQDLNLVITSKENPLKSFEKEDLFLKLRKAVKSLKNPHRTIVCLYYGINLEEVDCLDKFMTIHKISRILKIEKEDIELMLNEAHSTLAKDNQLLSLLSDNV